MQWRLQVNRLQELIDQLECKVSGCVASAPWGGPSWSLSKPGTSEAWPTLRVPHRPLGWNPYTKRSLPRGLTR